MQTTLLKAVGQTSRAIRDSTTMLENLIRRCDEAGIPQTTVANAADMSQAQVSRILTGRRGSKESRKAARAPRRSREGGTV
jgi:hypothetical protein